MVFVAKLHHTQEGNGPGIATPQCAAEDGGKACAGEG